MQSSFSISQIGHILFQKHWLINNSLKNCRVVSTYLLQAMLRFCRLDNFKKRFSKPEDHSGLSKEYRPNHCLRDTIASMLFSNGATQAKVAYQLGYAPESPMTKRYAKFVPVAQQSIANKAQEAMRSLLKHPAEQVAKKG